MATPVYDETAQNWPGAIPDQRDREWPGAVTLDYPPSADPAPASSPAAEPEAAPADPDSPDSRKPIEMREAAYWTAPGLEKWAGPVGVYPNRQPPWPPNAIRRFRRVLRISVQTEAGWAEECRTIDCESLAAGIADIPEFVTVREVHGHKDATAYFSIDRWPAVLPILRQNNITPDRLRLHIAWWTGNPQRIPLDDGWEAWAHQFMADNALGITRSMVWGRQDFDMEHGR